jgi:hypothetical protein
MSTVMLKETILIFYAKIKSWVWLSDVIWNDLFLNSCSAVQEMLNSYKCSGVCARACTAEGNCFEGGRVYKISEEMHSVFPPFFTDLCLYELQLQSSDHFHNIYLKRDANIWKDVNRHTSGC